MKRICCVVLTIFSGTVFARAQVTLAPGDAAKLLLDSPTPAYPALAAQARIGGTVTLRLVVSTQGRVASVDVLLGHPLLLQAALDAAKESFYRRFSVDGKPSTFQTTVQFAFTPPSFVVVSPTPSPANKGYATQRMRCEVDLSNQKWSDGGKSCSALLPTVEEYGYSDLVHEWIGTAMLGQGRYQDALVHYETSLKLIESGFPGAIGQIGQAQIRVGEAYHSLGNLDMARDYYAMAARQLQAAIEGTSDKAARRELENSLKGVQRLNSLARPDAKLSEIHNEILKQLEQLK